MTRPEDVQLASQTDQLSDTLSVHTFYLGCLAQASYLVIDTTASAAYVIDPRRDVDIYIEAAAAAGVAIQGVFETHVHADFVSGHLELSQRTGSPVYIGPAQVEYEHTQLVDGEVLGKSEGCSIQALHTPGHTTACMTFVLRDGADKPLAAFTGDTLFIGSVGRSDLLGSMGHSQEEMAEMMYQTLRERILTLPDDVVVYPGHGAGSPCGKGLSSDLSSTIGRERLTNPGLLKAAIDDSSVFTSWTVDGQPSIPQYFVSNVECNLSGAADLANQVAKVPELSAQEFVDLSTQPDTVILDTRTPSESDCIIPEAIWIPVGQGWGTTITRPEDGNFSLWVGTLISPSSKILLIAPEGKAEVVLARLGRIGYTQQVVGMLQGGISSWVDAGLPSLPNRRLLVKDLEKYQGVLLDVRTTGEYACPRSGHVTGSMNIPLSESFHKDALKLSKEEPITTYCISGFRSCVAASLLRRAGYDATDLVGGNNEVIKSAPELMSNCNQVSHS